MVILDAGSVLLRVPAGKLVGTGFVLRLGGVIVRSLPVTDGLTILNRTGSDGRSIYDPVYGESDGVPLSIIVNAFSGCRALYEMRRSIIGIPICKGVALFCHMRCGNRLAMPVCLLVCFRETIIELYLIGIQLVVNLHHSGAIGGNGLLLNGLGRIPLFGLRRHVRGAVGVALPGLRLHIAAAVQLFGVILHGVVHQIRLPVGLQRHAGLALRERGHNGDAAVAFSLCCVPAIKGVARSFGVSRPCQGRAAAAGKPRRGGTALGVKGNIAHTRRVAPLQMNRLADGRGGKRQRCFLPHDGHVRALRQRAVHRRHRHGVGGRVIAEHRVGKGDAEIALRGIVPVQVLQFAGPEVHSPHQIRAGGQRQRFDRFKGIAGIVRVGKGIDVIYLPRRPQRPLVGVQRGVIRQLAAGKRLRHEFDFNVNADLDEHGAGAVGGSPQLLLPCLMVVEIAPELDVAAHLGGNADLVHLQREQTHIHFQLDARPQGHGAYHVEIKAVLGGNEVDGLVCGGLGLHPDGEVIALVVLVLEVHTHGHVQIGGHHKAALDLPAENVQESAAAAAEQLLIDNGAPGAAGVLHQVLVGGRKALHAGGGGVRTIGELLQQLHHLLQPLAQRGVRLLLIFGVHHGLEIHAGVVAHLKGGVERVVILQKADLVALGADALLEQHLLLKLGRDLHAHITHFHGEGHNDSHAETIATKVLKLAVHTDPGCRPVYLSRGAVRLQHGPADGLHPGLNFLRSGNMAGVLALQQHSGHILRRLLHVAALLYIVDQVLLELALLLRRQSNILCPLVVNVQRFIQRGSVIVLIFVGFIGNEVLRTVLALLNAGDFAVGRGCSVFAVSTVTERNKITHIQCGSAHVRHGLGHVVH